MNAAVSAQRPEVPKVPEVPVVPAGRRGPVWLPPVVVAVAVVVLGLVPVLRVPAFYFWDDSAAVFLPTWRAAGLDLLAGHWPAFRPDFWMGGNWAVEAQFGLWSPVNLLVMMGTALIGDLVVASVVIKIAFQVLLATGVYALAREYGVRPSIAAAVAIALPFNGFTLYYDTATWIAGLMAFAWTAWFWWATRRCMDGRLSPVAMYVLGYLLVTNGNPYGALGAVIVLGATAVEALVNRNARGFWTIFVTGALVGGTTIAAFLPLVLSSSAGWREASGIFNDGFLVPDLTMLVGSSTPGARPFIRLWAGSGSTVPMAYSAWFLVPLLPWLPWRVLRDECRALSGLAIVGVAYLALTLGPSNLWLFRWPARLLEYVWMVVFLMVAVLVSRGLQTSWWRVRAAASAFVVLFGGWLAYSAVPSLRHAPMVAVHLVLVALLVAAILRAPRAVASVMVAGTAIVAVGHAGVAPYNRDVAQWWFPADAAAQRAYQERFDGPIAQVATPDLIPIERRAEAGAWILFGSMAGGMGVESTSSYTGIGHNEFSRTLCMNHAGATCADALTRLFEPAGAGLQVPLADALKVRSVVVQNALVPDVAQRAAPVGWSVAERNEWVTVLRRTADLPWPGSRLAAVSEGVTVVDAASTPTEETLRVSTGADDGRLLFARLNWPGYTATLDGQPLPMVKTPEGLLEIEVPAGRTDAPVSVRFEVPGFRFAVPLLAADVVIALGLGAVWHLRRRAVRRAASASPSA